MLRNVWCVVRGWFVAPAPVSAPASVVVQSPKSFEFYVLPSHKGKMIATGTVTAANENSALQSIYALCGERVQIVGGGRYRVHNSNGGGMLYTRIDRANRRREGDRRRHRETRVERADFGIVGE